MFGILIVKTPRLFIESFHILFVEGFIPVRDEQDWNPRRMVDNNQRKSTIQKIDLMDGNYDGVGIRWIYPGFTLGLVTL